jgi:acetaldehyde dehydrogenase/alcohol dehydrogenase
MTEDKERKYADELVSKARAAARAFERLDQEQTDRIVEAVFRAAFDARIRLAEAAVDETFLGKKEDKVRKNVFSSLIVFRDIKDVKTVGVVAEDPSLGLYEVAHPVGTVLCLTPVTNPTSTAINKALICLKTRNPVIFSPHKAAKRCTRLAAEICYEAARQAGAPEDCIQWTTKSKWSYTEALMEHPGISLVLATTAFHFVKDAHKRGNPVLGAGEGNVPVFIDRSADIERAAAAIVESKTFDNGTVCCSEQALVVTREIEKQVRAAFEKKGARFLDAEEVEKLGRAAFDASRNIMRSEVVGQSAEKIAEKAGIDVPQGTTLLIAPLERIGPDEPLSHEILAPILAFYVANDQDAAERTCLAVNEHHGKGHTLSIHAHDDALVKRFSLAMKAGRVLINTPSSLGGLGGTFNRLHPSLTLSCGGEGGNYTSDNITIRHLLEVNRVAPFDVDKVWAKIPGDAWMNEGFDSRKLDPLF